MMFLGFMLFLTIAMIGFWLLTFLISVIPYWMGGILAERMGWIKEESPKK
ncbi:MAG: hypothetical protein ABFR62_06190 [Bacteroidota bacterium]